MWSLPALKHKKQLNNFWKQTEKIGYLNHQQWKIPRLWILLECWQNAPGINLDQYCTYQHIILQIADLRRHSSMNSWKKISMIYCRFPHILQYYSRKSFTHHQLHHSVASYLRDSWWDPEIQHNISTMTMIE